VTLDIPFVNLEEIAIAVSFFLSKIMEDMEGYIVLLRLGDGKAFQGNRVGILGALALAQQAIEV
jgi:hypothetical protein